MLTVMPGFVETEGFPQHSTLSSRLLRRFVIEPDEVAAKIVDAVESGKRELTVPWFPYRLDLDRAGAHAGDLLALRPGVELPQERLEL